MLYDYSGFPAAAYALRWPAPGAPALAARVRQLLTAAGIPSREGARSAAAPSLSARALARSPSLTRPSSADAQRGFDHGTFVPMMVAFPEATIPTTQLSLLRSLDPAAHLALGAALAPLRDEGVLVIGSGMSYHNMRGLMVRQLFVLRKGSHLSSSC
jgi:aromatic ring-opening dioxygenase catalytic subunit (LigB family)